MHDRPRNHRLEIRQVDWNSLLRVTDNSSKWLRWVNISAYLRSNRRTIHDFLIALTGFDRQLRRPFESLDRARLGYANRSLRLYCHSVIVDKHISVDCD